MRAQTTRDIGTLIKRRRQELGLSQRDVANRINASRQWIIELERGKPTLSLEMVLRAMAALELICDVHPAGVSAATTTAPVVDLRDVLKRTLAPERRKKHK